MKQSKASLFLMELIICILFFSLAAAVCVQLFVRSHNLSKRTVDQSQAVIIAENLAECFYATEGDPQQISGYFSSSHVEESPEYPSGARELTLYFNADWQETSDPDSAAYLARLLVLEPGSEENPEEDLISGIIRLQEVSKDDPFYELNLKVHRRLSLGTADLSSAS